VFEGRRKDAKEMKIFVSIMLLSLSTVVYALQLKDVHVFSEDDDQDARNCSVTANSSTAAVEAVLRQNGIRINANAAYDVYVPFTVINLSTTCVVSYKLQVYFLTRIVPPGGRTATSIRGEICSKSGVMTGNRGTLQTRLNNAFKSYAEQCISEIERK
jgi:uncharacterized membrane-anchored protein